MGLDLWDVLLLVIGSLKAKACTVSYYLIKQQSGMSWISVIILSDWFYFYKDCLISFIHFGLWMPGLFVSWLTFCITFLILGAVPHPLKNVSHLSSVCIHFSSMKLQNKSIFSLVSLLRNTKKEIYHGINWDLLLFYIQCWLYLAYLIGFMGINTLFLTVSDQVNDK